MLLPFLLLGGTTLSGQQGRAPVSVGSTRWLEAYREPAGRLIGEAVSDTFAWRRLALMTDLIGPRLSGSSQLEHAVQWTLDEMKRDGLENVHAEPVIVPHWVRGAESAEIVEPARQPIVLLGLGGTIATPAEGLQAEVLIAHDLEELESLGAQAKGRIVLLNVRFTTYEESVRFRTAGPSRAARLGAVAMLVRSIAPDGQRTPHTGVLTYASDAPKIPAAAIASEDADRLQRWVDRGTRPVVRIKLDGHHFESDALSANVIGELRGRERPDEIVVVGGHLDSWDVGAGASDDGAGCIVTWEALRIMKKLNMRPRRTVRVVLWTNEENGGRGGQAYRDQHRAELAKHVMMLESDIGVFKLLGFGYTGNSVGRQTVRAIASLLSGIGATEVFPTGGGADITPSVQEAHIPALSLDSDDSKYFYYHHTAADTVDKIDPIEIARSAAAVAVMAYVVADLPQRLGDEIAPASR
jgi:carboxypeptidase Q